MNWKQAFALGLCSVGAYAEKEPVAYLYNGVRLPKLPEWDRETYPYALILRTGLGFRFIVYPADAYYFESNGSWYFGVNEHISANSWNLTDDGTEWDGGYLTLNFCVEGGLFNTKPYWANFDVVGMDGSVVTPASDPIPVYE